MVQKKVDYSKGMIYKLCCKDPEITEIYIGSTTNKKIRKTQHKTKCTNSNSKDYNCYKYQFIRETGGFENWDMIMIEEFPCNSKNELETRERYWIETLKPKLNKIIPTRTNKEYREEHKIELNKKRKEWIEKNKEDLCNKKKEYYEKNKDKIKKYYEEHKEEKNKKHKKWCEKNKEKISKKSKEYREKNKEKINKKQKEWYEKNKKEKNEKIKCEKCNCLITKQNLRAHQKTMKCKMMSECLFSDDD